jgi:hypothetical protein
MYICTHVWQDSISPADTVSSSSRICRQANRCLWLFKRHSPVSVFMNIVLRLKSLLFGRETCFPVQTLQRWYMYKSHQEMETNLIMSFKAAI